MQGATEAVAEALAALAAAEAALVRELAGHEAWRALRQLDERERRGEAILSVDGGRLRSGLEAALDAACPYWRAWQALAEARAHLAPLPLSRHASPAPAPLTGAAAPAGPDVGPEPVSAGGTRIKVKATTAADPAPEAVAIEPVSAAAGAAPPATAATTAQPAVARAAETSAATPSAVPSSPARSELLRGDLSRIRPIDSVLARSPDRDGDRDRFDGAVPWARLGSPPPVPAEPRPPVPSSARTDERRPRAGFAGSVAHTARAPAGVRPVATPPSSSAAITAPPTAVPPASPTPPRAAARPAPGAERTAAAVASTGSSAGLGDEDRLAALEAELDLMVGIERRGRAREPAAETELDVEEAEVLIVPRARAAGIAEEPDQAAVTSAPVALSIRLKQPEREVEFDSVAYAAYHDAVEEADVEIVRTPAGGVEPAEAAEASADTPASAKPRTQNRFLKVLSGE